LSAERLFFAGRNNHSKAADSALKLEALIQPENASAIRGKNTWGEHPIAGSRLVNDNLTVKQNKSFPNRKQNSPTPGPSLAALWRLQNETTFAPSADDVARKVGLSLVNQALQPLREVRRWLAAEAKLIAEHNLVRVRSFHHRNY
jgi:hypothetical protein